MPEDGKRNQHKNRSDPKEQRRPRQRHQAVPVPVETKVEKKKEESKATVPKKPTYEEPPPEFYKNLKRETEEILKITEEASSKYKKKEIQSNWSKYEMPIESYDEIQEQENMGADYEKLIEAPLSIGGHFQFKHEKTWDVDISPSLYDKYFEIDMDNLFVSISSLPLYERNKINKTIFTEADILTMTNRATRYKQKYYNDKTFTTPELDAQDKILDALRENKQECKSGATRIERNEEKSEGSRLKTSIEDENKIDLENAYIKIPLKTAEKVSDEKLKTIINDKQLSSIITTTDPAVNKNQEELDNIDDILLIHDEKPNVSKSECKTVEIPETKVAEPLKEILRAKHVEPETQKNPVIESPEDLEKWLDDFLDG